MFFPLFRCFFVSNSRSPRTITATINMPPRSAASNRCSTSWLDRSSQSSSTSSVSTTFSDTSTTSLCARDDRSFDQEEPHSSPLQSTPTGKPLLARRWTPAPITSSTFLSVAVSALVVLAATTQFSGAAQASSSMVAAPVTLVNAWASSLAQTGFYQAFVLVFLS